MVSAKKGFHFEDSLEKLEKLVADMEEGDFSLEQSLKAFEEGIRLTRECQEALKKAEQKIQLLVEKNGQLEAEPFDPEDPEND